MSDVIKIDGSAGEGGGQVLRVATGLAALLRRPVRITDIRANRPRPGLAAQHLAGIRALVRLTGGTAEGLEQGSREVLFIPGEGLKSRLEVDVGTAGSVTLVLQGLLIALARSTARVRLTLRGGTDVAWSPPWFYFSEVICPLLDRMGIQVVPRMVRPGYYPKGGGEVEVSVRSSARLDPLQPRPLGDDVQVHAFASASADLERGRVAERMVTGARTALPELRAHRSCSASLSTGCSIVMAASGEGTILGADAQGERGVRAEEVGRRAAEELKQQLDSRCTLDRWASDQVLPYIALADGESEFVAAELTSHARTSMEIVVKFLPCRFETEEREGGGVRVTCKPGQPGVA